LIVKYDHPAMTLEQLRVFVEVAERLHMTRAAQALHLTQSAASAAIAALEARYNVRLFDRVGRHLELSQAGRAFLPEARALLLGARNATQALDDLAGLKRGTLTLAASQTVSSYWLPQRMARFAARYPAIVLSMKAFNTAQVADAVREGAADLGFVEGVVDHPALLRRKLGADRIALYAAKDHPLAGKSAKLSDLRRASWVLREQGSGTRAQFEAVLFAKGLALRDLNVVLEMPSNEAALAAVESGGFLTAVSALAAAPHLAAGLLAPVRYDLGARSFELLTFKERGLSRAAQTFIALLAERTN
jgi:DNA-binding transcriptional LysR family regulator